MDLTPEQIEQFQRDSEELKRLKKDIAEQRQKEATDEAKSTPSSSSADQVTVESMQSILKSVAAAGTVFEKFRMFGEMLATDLAKSIEKFLIRENDPRSDDESKVETDDGYEPKSADETKSDATSSSSSEVTLDLESFFRSAATVGMVNEMIRRFGETFTSLMVKFIVNVSNGEIDCRSHDKYKVEPYVYKPTLEFQHRSFSLCKRISDAAEAKLTYNIPQSKSLIIINEPDFRKKYVEPEDLNRITPDFFDAVRIKPWIGNSDYRVPEEFLREFVFRIKTWCENNWMLNQAFLDLLQGEDFELEYFKRRVNCNESFRLTAIAFITEFSTSIAHNSDLLSFAKDTLIRELRPSEFVRFWLRRLQYNPHADPNWVMKQMALKLPDFRCVFKQLRDDATVDDIIKEVRDFEMDEEKREQRYTVSSSSYCEQNLNYGDK